MFSSFSFPPSLSLAPHYFALDQVINFFDRQINLCMSWKRGERKKDEKIKYPHTQKSQQSAAVYAMHPPHFNFIIILIFHL